MKKITFITYHNWETKRHGGFHQFAKYAAEKGNEVVFFSFSRPYYSVLKHEERLNATVLKKLNKGLEYRVGKGVLFNVTWPTLALPGNIRNFFPDRVNVWLMTHSFKPFRCFQKQWLEGSDCFVFESCDAVYLLEDIKKYNPQAKIIYRPSDPIADLPSERYLIASEKKMLKCADKIILVNAESRDLYRIKFNEDYDDNKAIVIKNGVEVEAYYKKYPIPSILDYPKTAVYIGVFAVDWRLLQYAAKSLPDIRFVIVNPNLLSSYEQAIIDNNENLFYIQGISPDEVPKWVTNASIIIQPYPEGNVFSKRIGLSLTAMHYKAMAANKPIVSHMIKKSMEKYGLFVTETFSQFVDAVRHSIDIVEVKYSYDIKQNDWDILCAKFIEEIDI